MASKYTFCTPNLQLQVQIRVSGCKRAICCDKLTVPAVKAAGSFVAAVLNQLCSGKTAKRVCSDKHSQLRKSGLEVQTPVLAFAGAKPVGTIGRNKSEKQFRRCKS